MEMTQLNIENLMKFKKEGTDLLCRIEDIDIESNMVSIQYLGTDKIWRKENDVEIGNLKPIKASDAVLKAFGISLSEKKDPPSCYGYPDNQIYSIKIGKEQILVFKDSCFYHILSCNSLTCFHTGIYLCVHHIQNLMSKYRIDYSTDAIIDKLSV